jgi:hypothetical protein
MSCRLVCAIPFLFHRVKQKRNSVVTLVSPTRVASRVIMVIHVMQARLFLTHLEYSKLGGF